VTTTGPRAPERAYVGLGANLGERRATIMDAIGQIDQLDGVTLVEMSRLRETEPVGVVDQPSFLNGACSIDVSIEPRMLLDGLLGIEARLGRVRDGTRWGPRAIDLDVLLFGARELDEPALTIPHPRLHERGFVLEPLLDLELDLTLPDGRRVKDLFSALK
jgi:2-amino-4-hydroxy-6-hydroxymethyldihydropteridine diphosphokinase